MYVNAPTTKIILKVFNDIVTIYINQACLSKVQQNLNRLTMAILEYANEANKLKVVYELRLFWLSKLHLGYTVLLVSAITT